MRYLITIVGGFASGIFLRSLFVFGWWPIIIAGGLSAILGLRFYVGKHPRHILAAVFCFFLALGMMRALFADTSAPEIFARNVDQRVTYEGVVVSDPDVRDANQRFQIRVTTGTVTTHMLVVAPRSAHAAVGDTVQVSGTLQKPEAFATEGGRTFRYDKYLQRDGVRFILSFASVRVLKRAPWYSVPAQLARLKHMFLSGIETTLPEPYASLAGGVVIGGKSGLGSELQNAFIRSGLIQIIVLSGYNVMVVAEWVMALLALTRLKKNWRALSGATALLIFVGIAGFTATAIRAALMALLALYARATGRSYAAGRALVFVILLMLVSNPLYLVFDPGFGLSVVATAGLIWLAPIIEVFLHIKNAFWKNAIATTLAAQIAVLPLLLYDTGNLSFVSVPANLLTIPMVPLAMGFSALAGFGGIVFGTFAPLVGIVLAYPAYIANAYLIWIAKESAALPGAALTLPLFPFWLVVLTYVALIFIASSKRFSTMVQLRFAKKASI